MTKTILRAELKDGKTYDIIGYDIDLGRFDCDGGRTLTYDEVKFFYITPEVLKDMVGTIKVQTETKTKANKKNEVKASVAVDAVDTSVATKDSDKKVSE